MEAGNRPDRAGGHEYAEAWRRSPACRRCAPGSGAAGNVPRVGLVERVQRVLQRLRIDLDARQMLRIEGRIGGTRGRATGDLEHGVEPITDDAASLRAGPAAGTCQSAIFRPDAERQRECPDVISRNRGINRELTPRDLFLHDRVGVFAEVRVPERVAAQLEALLVEKLHFLESPGGAFA